MPNFGLKSFLKSLDLFGQPILLSFKGKTFYKTFIGGIFSLTLVTLIIAFSFEALISLLSRDNIKVAYSEIYEPDSPLIEFSADRGFTFAIGFSIAALNNYTQRYFDIQVANVINTRSKNGTTKQEIVNVKLKTCSQEDFPKNYDYIENNHFNWKCLAKNQTLLASGIYYGSLFQYIRVTVDKCVNSSLNNNSCASKDEMEEMMNLKIYLNIVFSNKILNLQDYTNPYINYMDSSVFFLIDPRKIFKQADIFFQKKTINMDDNLWFFQSKNSFEFTFQEFREQTMDIYSNRVASFYLRSSNMRGHYIASSEKITFMLARLGGLMGMFYNIFRIFVRIYTRRKLLISLSNFLYKCLILKPNAVQNNNNKNLQACKKKLFFSTKKIQDLNFSEEKKESNLELDDNIIGHNLIKGCIFFSKDKDEGSSFEKDTKILNIIKNYLLQFSKIKFNIFGSISAIFRKKNKKNILIIDKALKKLKLDMDIVEFLKKNKEIDRLKDFLFDHNERTLFEFFPKPTLNSKELSPGSHKNNKTKKNKSVLRNTIRPSNDFLKKMRFLKETSEKQELCSYFELYKAFLSIKSRSKSNMPEKTRQLIEFVEGPLKEIFTHETLKE